MTNWTLPNRCPSVDSKGRRCTQDVGHAFDHVPEVAPGEDPRPAPTNWLKAFALAVLGIAAAGALFTVLNRL